MAHKQISGDFDLSAWEMVVKAIPNGDQGQIMYEIRGLDALGKPFVSPEASGVYPWPAHPDRVAELPTWLYEKGLRGKRRLIVHPPGQVSKTLLTWDFALGEGEAVMSSQPQHLTHPATIGTPAPQPVQVASPAPPNPWAQPMQPMQPMQPPQPQQGQPPPYYQPPHPYPAHPYPPGPWGAPPPPATAEDPRVAALERELAAMRSDRERDRAERAAVEERARQERERRELLDAIAAVKRDVDAKLAAVTAAKPAEPAGDRWVALVGALGPLWIQSQTSALERERLQRESDQKSREEQMKMWGVLLERRTDPVVERLVSQVEQISKGAQNPAQAAEMLSMVTQSMFGSFSMAMQMFQQLVENQPEASPMRDLLGQAIAGAKQVFETYVRTQVPQPTAPKQLPAQATPPPAAAAPADQGPDLQTRDGVLAYLRAMPAIPDDWKTKPWAAILAELGKRTDPDHVGRALATHVYHLWAYECLPDLLAPLDDVARFREPWAVVLAVLPMSSTEDGKRYLDSVLEVADQVYRELRGTAEEQAAESAHEAEAEPVPMPPRAAEVAVA